MSYNNKKINKNIQLLCINAAMQEVCVSWTVYNTGGLIKSHVHTSYIADHTRRSEKLVPSIEHVKNLTRGDFDKLSCIGLIIGPGSFTGLRNSLSFAKGIASVQNIPIVGILTHDYNAFKHGIFTNTADTSFKPLLVINDARGKKYYSALYLKKLSLDTSLEQTCSSSSTASQAVSKLCFGYCNIYDSSLEQLCVFIQQEVQTTQTIRCVSNNTKEELAHIVHQLKRMDNTHNYIVPASSIHSHEALRDFSIYCYINNKNILLDDAQPVYIRSGV